MKVVCLNGSPRKKGNSATLSTAFGETAKDMGAQVNTYFLNSLEMKGCQGCYACKSIQDKCILKDELDPVLEDIRNADVLVLATPVYFADVTSQTKQFIDRTYSYLVPDFMTNPSPSRLEKGKRLVFIQAQAQGNPELFNDIYPKYEFFFQLLGFKDSILIRACGVGDAEDVNKDESLIEQARQAAQTIMS